MCIKLKKFLLIFSPLVVGLVFSLLSFRVSYAHVQGEFTATNHNHVVNSGATSQNPSNGQTSNGLWYSEAPYQPVLFPPGSIVLVNGSHPFNIPPQTSIVSVDGEQADSSNQTGTNPSPNVGNGTNQTLTQTGGGFQSADSPLPACGILPDSAGTIEGCFVRLFYYILLYPTSWLAATAGQIFDYFIAFTLNSESYDSGGFVEQGWRILRDLVNVSFIFILLYVAIRYIINAQKADMARTVTRIILIAIVINFSLFATRIIIDAGNILGRVFYEKIIIENDDQANITQYKTLSAGLVAIVNPQKLLTEQMFTKKYRATATDAATQQNTLGTLQGVGDSSAGQGFEVGAGFLIFIIIMASAVNLALVWIFISVSIFLIGRTLGLWIMMIMSPLAFASVSIPFLKIPKYGFSDWISRTLRLSFMVVVFMFFLYLTIMFINVGFTTIFNLTVNEESSSTIHLIMAVLIPLGAVLFLLKTAKDTAKSAAGEFGDFVGKGLKYASVAALGTAGFALGGAAFLGRQTLGRAGMAMANNASTKTAAGRFAKRSGKYLSTSSFDARNMKIPKPIGTLTNTAVSYATDGNVKSLDFGKGTTKGGIQTRRQAFIDDKIKKAKELAPDEGTSVIVKDKTGKDVSTSVSETKREFERKRYAVQNDPVHDYSTKKKAQEKYKKDLEEKEKEYKNAKQRLTDGKITKSDYDTISKEYEKIKKDKEDKDEEVKNIEALWKDEERMYKEAQSVLGKQKSEHYRNYSDSIDSFDPRRRAGEASDAVEDLAYQQDKKNEADEKNKDKK